jgi:NADPH2:quinone reductase
MRAVLLERYGGPEVLRIAEVAMPEPKPGEVRVRIDAIGINFAEVLSRTGTYGWAPPLPYIPGMEACGVVEGTGERVIVGGQYGAYAEAICVPARQALKPPAGYSTHEAAAFAVNYLTAWVGLMEMARLRASDTLLVTAAAGGVGSAAVQLAKKLGATVIGAASAAKHDVVRSLGADQAIEYGEIANVRPNVVLEMVGGAAYRDALRALAPMGRIVLTGISSVHWQRRNPLSWLRALRDMPRVSVRDMLMRSYGVMSFHVGRLFVDEGISTAVWDDLVHFVEQRGIRPLIGRVYPFEEIAQAHRDLESRRSVGKLVVDRGRDQRLGDHT